MVDCWAFLSLSTMIRRRRRRSSRRRHRSRPHEARKMIEVKADVLSDTNPKATVIRFDSEKAEKAGAISLQVSFAPSHHPLQLIILSVVLSAAGHTAASIRSFHWPAVCHALRHFNASRIWVGGWVWTFSINHLSGELAAKMARHWNLCFLVSQSMDFSNNLTAGFFCTLPPSPAAHHFVSCAKCCWSHSSQHQVISLTSCLPCIAPLQRLPYLGGWVGVDFFN